MRIDLELPAIVSYKPIRGDYWELHLDSGVQGIDFGGIGVTRAALETHIAATADAGYFRLLSASNPETIVVLGYQGWIPTAGHVVFPAMET